MAQLIQVHKGVLALLAGPADPFRQVETIECTQRGTVGQIPRDFLLLLETEHVKPMFAAIMMLPVWSGPFAAQGSWSVQRDQIQKLVKFIVSGLSIAAPVALQVHVLGCASLIYTQLKHQSPLSGCLGVQPQTGDGCIAADHLCCNVTL